MNKKKLTIIVLILIAVFSFLAIFINCLFKIKATGFFVAEWAPGDALNYIAVIASAISTFLLGLVAFMQNEKLHQLEKNNFIANNSSMVLIDSFQLEPIAKLQLDYAIHTEQILSEKDNNNEIGYKCSITLKNMGTAIPSLIYISKATLIVSNKDKKTICSDIWAENIRKGFTRMCVLSNKKISVSMTLLVNKKNREKLENALIDGNKLMIEFMFIILTDKYVGTQCKCRASCEFQAESNTTNWISTTPQVFFYGNDVLDKNKIVILGEKEDNIFDLIKSDAN